MTLAASLPLSQLRHGTTGKCRIALRSVPMQTIASSSHKASPGTDG